MMLFHTRIKVMIFLSLLVMLGCGGEKEASLSVSKLDKTLKKKCKSFCKDSYGSDDSYMYSKCYDRCLDNFYIEADQKDRKRDWATKTAASKTATTATPRYRKGK